MLYSLPNGKVIYLTIEEYLDLTDQDIQMLMSLNAGEGVSSPWHGSVISRRSAPRKEEVEDEDRSLDYQAEYEEPLHGSTSSDDSGDYPELPDDESNLD